MRGILAFSLLRQAPIGGLPLQGSAGQLIDPRAKRALHTGIASAEWSATLCTLERIPVILNWVSVQIGLSSYSGARGSDLGESISYPLEVD
jgi:hypothetical protein